MSLRYSLNGYSFLFGEQFPGMYETVLLSHGLGAKDGGAHSPRPTALLTSLGQYFLVSCPASGLVPWRGTS